MKQIHSLLDRLWMVRAACSRHATLPWTAEKCPEPDVLIQMHDICANRCPVRRECAEFALRENGGRGVTGGFYAGVWLPWMTYDEKVEVKHARERARRLLRACAGKRARNVQAPGDRRA